MRVERELSLPREHCSQAQCIRILFFRSCFSERTAVFFSGSKNRLASRLVFAASRLSRGENQSGLNLAKRHVIRGSHI